MSKDVFFSDDHVELLQEEYLAVSGKCLNLVTGFLTHNFNNPRAREYAMHGLARRLNTLSRCIENTFGILPPDSTDMPTREQLSDAAINIQAFIFNVFGSMDNLAWVWISEKALTKKDGSPIPNSWVGLGKDNTFVRGSLSAEFQTYLTGLDAWFGYLEDFRHALAHRIPLYIPPYIVSPANEAAYREHQEGMDAAMASGDYAEYDRLWDAQTALGAFRPWVTHSVGEQQGRPVMLHAQLLADFATVEVVAQKMLAELSR